ncbi:MAG: hypothetical protein QG597_805 [Actinomycetota bacterium]|nr:hypothetical protein [Actinomycetota bacterium]
MSVELFYSHAVTTVPDVVSTHFPGAIGLTDFLDRKRIWLQGHGFRPGDALAVTACCRDEIVSEFRAEVRRQWNWAFDFSSLSALPLAGATGIRAAIDHAPRIMGHPEIVVFALPHVGILEDGTAGHVMRRGRSRPTTACGSLMAAQRWAAATAHDPTATDLVIDPTDAEQSLVRIHLRRQLGDFSTMSPIALTEHVRELMLRGLWRQFTELTDTLTVDVALISAVLVHGHDGDYVQPKVIRLRRAGAVSETSGGV